MSINDRIFLTENFQLFEFTRSATASRLGISNEPNDKEIGRLRTLCEDILQPARAALGPLKISSGFRSEALNAAVGGVPNSDHRLGVAADVIPVSVGSIALARWIQNNVQFDQVILEFGTLSNPDWIHISNASRARGQVLRTLDGINYDPIRL
jgi:zinc D-Ala-D-Ala carboxypeptidase